MKELVEMQMLEKTVVMVELQVKVSTKHAGTINTHSKNNRSPILRNSRYHEGALVFEKDTEGAPINLEPPTCRRREYIPSTGPSSRFPHMNVRVFPTSQESVGEPRRPDQP
uniref:FAD/NAD(P)-binding oxidoreductase family protein n=1 Tax=Tanacetum cinerariifolium TaxID=118510 RepID=A0A699HEZ9_TANCI|nr:FAD/NAD(P)-binding oxidoreductase family protein [Tanacetum cinerariifolium]